MRLVTWNIQWGRGVDGRVDLDRVVAHARRFADFDVLCLQEVAAGYPELAGHDGGDQFAALAARLPGFVAIDGVATDAPAGPDAPAGARRRFGQLILSRLPVASVFRHLLPWPVDATVRSMQRVALEATVLTARGPLRVTTTHLEYYSAPQRAAQVEALRGLHREATAHARSARPGGSADGPFAAAVARGGPAILVGDFNFAPTSDEHARMLAPYDDATPPLRDAWDVAHPRAARPPTVGVHDRAQWPAPAFACDFVFVGDDLATRVRAVAVDGATDASDHQPMMVELDVGA